VPQAVVETGMHHGKERDGQPPGRSGGVNRRGGPDESRDEWDVEGDEGSPRADLGHPAHDVEESPLVARDGIELMREQEAKQEEVKRKRHSQVSITSIGLRAITAQQGFDSMFLQSNQTARRTHTPVPNPDLHWHSTCAALITASGLDCRDCSLTFSRAKCSARGTNRHA
jgi:hypothetical protein